MPILFDSDPETGATEYFDYDPIKEEFSVRTEQDVTFFLDRMNAIRNNPDISAQGIKEDWWLYCSIPTVVELELLKKGLSLSNKDHYKAIMREINQSYPYLKATTKHHT